jgi:hypothetical protein
MIAPKDFPRKGFSACFDGPMFNWSPLALTHLGIRLYFKATGFIARKSYGYLLFTIYGAFLLVSRLCETKFVHLLGADHRPSAIL